MQSCFTNYFATISFFKLLLIVLFLLISPGCSYYRVPNQQFIRNCPNCNKINYLREKKALNHWLYRVVPRHRSQIRWYDIGHWTFWMLFGNDNDGIFGESKTGPYQQVRRNNVNKAISWWVRNPFHNFTNYTIGSGSKNCSELIILGINSKKIALFEYNKRAKYNFYGPGSSILIALHGFKPYISIQKYLPKESNFQFYLGWRKRDNFGAKCLIRRNYK